MTTSLRKKVFLMIFCLASITQGMYSTYFVSILTTIESIYQIQSKTAGALLSATEIGQILGSLFIAYYGGRGNKPKWIASCMLLSALAALISISPHFFLVTLNETTTKRSNETTINDMTNLSLSGTIVSSAYQAKDLSRADNVAGLDKQALQMIAPESPTTTTTTIASILTSSRTTSQLMLPAKDHLCRWESYSSSPSSVQTNSTKLVDTLGLLEQASKASATSTVKLRETSRGRVIPVGAVIVIFFFCLLAIGFGSTAITTLGIPYIDDIISKEESPLYLGLTIGLKIFGPAFGFLLGSFCVRLDLSQSFLANLVYLAPKTDSIVGYPQGYGAWWLGLIMISLPLILLSIPMYYLSKNVSSNDSERDDFEDITYQAAEDHDIGGSHDLPPHMLGLAQDLDVTSNRTCFSSEIDSSSREVLQAFNHSSPTHHIYSNYVKNLTLDQPVLSDERLLFNDKSLKQSPSPGPSRNSHNQIATEASKQEASWNASVCLVVNHFGRLESTSFTNSVANQSCPIDQDDPLSSCMIEHSQRLPPPSSSRSSLASTIDSSTSGASEANSKLDSKNDDQKQRKKRRKRRRNLMALAGLSRSLTRLLRNRLLVLRMISGILHILPIAGFYTFLPKYLIEQYRVTPSGASAISGLAGILFVGLGAFLGGTIVRLFNINSRMMTRWIAMSALFYAFGMIVLMNLGCSSNHIVHYGSQDFMLTDCSNSCKCSNSVYNPVCANGTTYISPCLAGCKSHSISEDKIIFDECGCMAQSQLSLNQTLAPSPNEHVNLNVATQGHCQIDCQDLVKYIIVFSAFTLIHASCEVGSMMFNLRCVKSHDRTLALGLVTFASSLLGTIPCSVIYGTVVDLTCVHWDRLEFSESSSEAGLASEQVLHGACRVYDNGMFRYYLHGITAFVMLLAFFVDCVICRYSNEVDFYDRSDSKTDIRLGLKKSTETI